MAKRIPKLRHKTYECEVCHHRVQTVESTFVWCLCMPNAPFKMHDVKIKADAEAAVACLVGDLAKKRVRK